MTDTIEDTPPEGPADQMPTEGEHPDGVQTADDGDTRLTKVRQEAKNLRTRLRDTETERDSLRASLNAYNHADASVIAAEHLSDGEDLFRGGVDLVNLLGDDGTVDDELVHEAARRVAADHPNWTPDRTIRSLTPGMPQSEAAGWQKVLKGR